MVVALGQQYHVGEKPATYIINRHAGTANKTKTKNTMSLDYSSINFVVVVVVVVFTLKTVLTSIQYPSLSYSSRQRNEFPWSHANPK